tara:strand:- start:10270 stop:11907 length:1638 start_codon:yes stop_codon:yes gene_type:complete
MAEYTDYSLELKKLAYERQQREAMNQQIIASSVSLGAGGYKLWAQEQGIKTQELLSELTEDGKPKYVMNEDYTNNSTLNRLFTPASKRVTEVDYGNPEDPAAVADSKATVAVSKDFSSEAYNPELDPNSEFYNPPPVDMITDAPDVSEYSQTAFDLTESSDLGDMFSDSLPIDKVAPDETGAVPGSDQWFANKRNRVISMNKEADRLLAEQTYEGKKQSVLFGEGTPDVTEYSETAIQGTDIINTDDVSLAAPSGDSFNPDAFDSIDAFLDAKPEITRIQQTADVRNQIIAGQSQVTDAAGEALTVSSPGISSETTETIYNLNQELQGGQGIVDMSNVPIEPTGNLSLRTAFQPEGGLNIRPGVYGTYSPESESVLPLMDKFQTIEEGIESGEILNYGDTSTNVVPGMQLSGSKRGDLGDITGDPSGTVGSAITATASDLKVQDMTQNIVEGGQAFDITDIVKETGAEDVAKTAGQSGISKALGVGGAALSAYDTVTNWDDMDDEERAMSAISTGTSIAAAMGLINPLAGLGIGLIQGIGRRMRG